MVQGKVNLVNGEGVFASSKEEVAAFMNEAGLGGSSKDYAVVGIMGCQSTGKSTLLNGVFGTDFDTLNASTGRKMTTKGVWLGASPLVSNVIVLDAEGTDSSNRGDDRGAFERQTALFSLALTEILIVNMWSNDIGRFTASNYPVLSTVFDVNLKLFAQESVRDTKTTLLFMIRDFSEEEMPLSIAEEQITCDMMGIWDSIEKPKGLETSKFDDFFTLRFSTLPHKMYKAAEFQQGIDSFRSKFKNTSDPDSFFNTLHHCKKSVPADGLGDFLQQIWKSIRENKDLDLPSEKKMFAAYRCDAIIHEICADELFCILKPLRDVIGRGHSEQFASQCQTVVEKVLTVFAHKTSGYDSEIVAEKSNDLRSKVFDDLLPLYLKELSNLRHLAREKFVSLLNEKVDRQELCDNFDDMVREMSSETMLLYSSLRSKAFIEGSGWTDSDEEMTEELDRLVTNAKEAQLEVLESLSRSKFKSLTHSEIVQKLTVCENELWEQLKMIQSDGIEKSLQFVKEKLKQLPVKEDITLKYLKALEKYSYDLIFEECSSHASMAKLKMHQRFDKLFRFDEKGLPRRWGTDESCRTLFYQVINESNQILDIIGTFQLENSTDSEIFINEDEKERIRQIFQNEVQGALVQAELAQERAQQFKLPFWAIVAMIVLGWDELMSILSNPFLFVLVIMGSFIALLVYQMGLENHVFSMAQNAMDSVKTKALEQLRNLLDDPVDTQRE